MAAGDARPHREAAGRGQGGPRSLHRGVTGDGRGRTLDVHAPRLPALALLVGRAAPRRGAGARPPARGPRTRRRRQRPVEPGSGRHRRGRRRRSGGAARVALVERADAGRPRRRARGAAPAFRLRRVHARRSGCWSRATEAAGGPSTLTIARGRFDAERVAARLRRRRRRARVATQWRGSPLWEAAGAGGRAGHAAHARAGRRPARARRRSTPRGASSPTRAAARSASCGARWTRTENPPAVTIASRSPTACARARRGCSPCRTACGGSARG